MLKKVKIAILCLLICCLIVPVASCAPKQDFSSTNQIDVCLASEPQSLDPGLNTSVDGYTMITHLFAGLSQWKKDESGQVVILPNLAKDLPEPVKGVDGKYTYTYSLVDDAKWSDGKPVTAQDFVFSWNRSASVEFASDYSYMFEIIDGYDLIWDKKNPDPNAKLNVTALDDRTLQVVTTSFVPYWNEYLAFPVFLPLREDVVDNDGMWATKPETYISNGAYKLTQWNHNSVIRMEKSDTFVYKDQITMPNINFFLSDNSNNMLANFKTGEWEFFKDIPTNEIATIKNENPDEYCCDPQTGIYYLSWVADFDLSPVNGQKLTEPQKAEVRNAISLLLDRNYITEYVAQGGQTPAGTYIPAGIKDTDGKMFCENAGDATKPYSGYFPTDKSYVKENYEKGIEILKKYYKIDSEGFFVDFPPITYIYNTNEGHKAIAEYFQNVLSSIGIKITLENMEWATFLSTKKTNGFTIARDSWIADYNDALCFLELNTTNAGNNTSKLGRGEHAKVNCYNLDLSDISKYSSLSVANGTWAETYDVLIGKIKTEEDTVVRNKLMHKAEDLLMSTGCISPLYYYTHTYMLSSKLKGFYSNPLGCDFFMYTYFE